MGDNQQFGALDILSIMSFLLGAQNLQENRQQIAHNVVSAANDRQAEFLLKQLTEKFEEQNVMLREIVTKLEEQNGKNDA